MGRALFFIGVQTEHNRREANSYRSRVPQLLLTIGKTLYPHCSSCIYYYTVFQRFVPVKTHQIDRMKSYFSPFSSLKVLSTDMSAEEQGCETPRRSFMKKNYGTAFNGTGFPVASDRLFRQNEIRPERPRHTHYVACIRRAGRFADE